MAQRYKRPPITEAVVEVRIASSIEQELLEKVKARLMEYYPLPPQRRFDMQVEVGEQSTKVRQSASGYRLTSADAAGVVLIGPSAISTSRLPPYEDWDLFIAPARRNWDIWKRLVGWREIARIGVRYINRI